MILQDFLPNAGLQSFVKCFRIVHFCFAADKAIPYKAYPPKPEQTLHFFLKEPFVIETARKEQLSPPAVLFTAQQTSLARRFTQRNFLDVQIVFQPTAVYRLTGIPATEFTNAFVDATLLFPRCILSAFSHMQAARSYEELLTLAEQLAFDLVRSARKETLLIDAACQRMVHQHGSLSLDWLAKESCYSSRQFKRKFAERVGLNPKTYARILRVNRAINIRNCFPRKDWSLIAAQGGYTDYQHLVKDYREFTGLTPPTFHLLENQSPEQFLGFSQALYRKRYTAPY